jgi:small subunit ribosomal protein S5
MAGIKDIWSKTAGQTRTKINLIGAVMDALKKLSRLKIGPEDVQKLGIIEGRARKGEK